MQKVGFHALQIIKTHSIDTPQVNLANASVVYANTPFTLTGSIYGGHFAGSMQSAEWEIDDATGVIWSNSSATSSVSLSLGTSVHTPVQAKMRYHGVSGTVSSWSSFLPLSFEYGLPYAAQQQVQLYAVSMSLWNSWQNTYAVWIAPPGDASLLVGQYISIQEPLTIATSGTYTVQFMADDGVRIVIDGTVLSDYNTVTTFHSTQAPNPNIVPTTLTAGAHTVVVTGYNGPFGTVWANNPGGFCTVICDSSNSIVFNLRDFVGEISYLCANGGTYLSSDGLCHLYSPPT